MGKGRNAKFQKTKYILLKIEKMEIVKIEENTSIEISKGGSHYSKLYWCNRWQGITKNNLHIFLIKFLIKHINKKKIICLHIYIHIILKYRALNSLFSSIFLFSTSIFLICFFHFCTPNSLVSKCRCM